MVEEGGGDRIGVGRQLLGQVTVALEEVTLFGHRFDGIEAEPDDAPSAGQRRKRVQALEAECARCVSERFRPALAEAIAAKLGFPQHAGNWLRYEIDALAGTPNLLLTYPSAVALAGDYTAKQVKLELGALTIQQPTGAHGIEATLAKTPGVDPGSAYDDLRANVVALELTRTLEEGDNGSVLRPKRSS